MITYQKHISRYWVAGVVALVAVAVAAWWQGAFNSRESVAPTDASASQLQASMVAPSGATPSQQSVLAAQAILDAPVIHPDGRPADIDAEEWDTLKKAAANHATPAVELERLVQFVRFQRGVESWQAMSGQGDTAERQRLGSKLIETLPAHLANAEVSMPEALMLCAAILRGEADVDPAVDQKVQQCKTRLEQSLPPPDKEKQRREAACRGDWEERKTKLTSEFVKKTPQERAVAQSQFEQELEAARVEIFSAVGCAGAV
jgi:hypothetical protein